MIKKMHEQGHGRIKGAILIFFGGLFFSILVFMLFRSSLYSELHEMNQQVKESTNSFWTIFFFALWEQTKSYGLLWVLSPTILKIPYILWIIVYKGFTTGFIFCFFVMEYGIRSVLFILMYYIPHGLIILPVYLYSFSKITRDDREHIRFVIPVLYALLILASVLEAKFNVPWMKNLYL